MNRKMETKQNISFCIYLIVEGLLFAIVIFLCKKNIGFVVRNRYLIMWVSAIVLYFLLEKWLNPK